MRKSHQLGIAALAVGLSLPALAPAALQVALHEVNTSTGLLPTSTANKWKLQTDPVVDISLPGPPIDLSTYEPISGSLCDSFDPTEFALTLNGQGVPQLGVSVVGLGAYEVTGFTEELTDGAIVVTAGANPGDPDMVNQTGGGTPNGVIDDITFQLRTDGVGGEADKDQLFYEVELDQIGDAPNPLLPGAFTFPDENSFVTIEPFAGGPTITTINDPNNPTNPEFINTSSSVPEPRVTVLMGVGAVGLLARRNWKRIPRPSIG